MYFDQHVSLSITTVKIVSPFKVSFGTNKNTSGFSSPKANSLLVIHKPIAK